MTPLAIAEALKADMLSGRLPPGADLQQVELADRFGVSRIPVRDALSILAAEKLVTVRPNRGASVTRYDAAGIAEFYRLRLLLESDCLRAALPAFDDADRAEIDYQLKRSNLEAGRPGWAVSDWDFHRALYAPSRRPMQIDLIGTLRQLCQVHIAGYDWLTEATDDWLADHAELVAAYLARDEQKTISILERHIGHVRDALVAAIRNGGQAHDRQR
jgi:DNA-binding GntR family transcriptional regulator